MKKLGKLLFITSLLLCFLIPRGWTQTQAKPTGQYRTQTEGNLHETGSHDSHA